MEAVVEHELSLLLSSHLVADLERVCDYLIVLVASRVRVAGGRRTLHWLELAISVAALILAGACLRRVRRRLP